MSEKNQQTEYTEDEIQKIRGELEKEVNDLMAKGCWVVASYTGIRYLGKVSKIYSNDHSYNITEPSDKAAVLKSLPGYIEMNPVFEYLIQLGPGQVPGGLSKIPSILPVDMTGNLTPLCMYNPHLLFLSDLQEGDVPTYKGLVQNGLVVTRGATLAPHDPTANAQGPRIVSPAQAAAEMAAMQGRHQPRR